jgi:sulfonate transport system permease protein
MSTAAATALQPASTAGIASVASRLAPSRRYLTPLALVAAWQAGSSAGLIPVRTIASPATILSTFADLTLSGELP